MKISSSQKRISFHFFFCWWRKHSEQREFYNFSNLQSFAEIYQVFQSSSELIVVGSEKAKETFTLYGRYIHIFCFLILLYIVYMEENFVRFILYGYTQWINFFFTWIFKPIFRLKCVKIIVNQPFKVYMNLIFGSM